MENITKDANGEIISQSNLLINGLEFKNETFDKFIREISPQIEPDSTISFTNCTFKLPAVFEGLKAKEVSFNNCIFEKEFFLLKSNISILGIGGCIFKEEANIIDINCTVYTIIRKIKASKVKISGQYKTLQIVSSKIEEFVIGNINSDHTQKDSAIEFLIENDIKKTKIEPYITFAHIVFKGSKYQDIHFEGTFNNRVLFEKKMEIQNLYFESSSFKSRIDFEEGQFEYVNFYRSNFEGLVYFSDFSALKINPPRDLSIKKLNIHSCNFEKDISIQLSHIQQLSITNNFFKRQLTFNNFNNLVNKDSMVMVFIDGVNQGNIILERLYADIHLGGINFGNIIFKESSFYTLFMSDFDNKGSISFNNINSSEFFTIQNSVSGKLNFLNTNSNNLGEIVISNSNIDGANFNEYPNNIRSFSSNPKVGYGLDDKSKNASNLKDVFNQLKQIAKRKGDIHVANKYQSLEHKQLLKSKSFGFDSILLFLNLISNKNGKSWSRGVLFTLSIAFIFFCVYLSTIGVELNNPDLWKEYILFISSYPKLNVEKYEALNSKWSVSLVIWLSRIFITYGIYQTVAAFRKYGKS